MTPTMWEYIKFGLGTLIGIAGIVAASIFAWQQNKISETQIRISENQNKMMETQSVINLISSLGDRNSVTQHHSIIALVKIGEPAVPYLVLALVNPNSSVNQSAREALKRMKKDPVQFAIDVLQKKNEDIPIKTAIEILGIMRDKARSIEQLDKMIMSAEVELSIAAIEALGQMSDLKIIVIFEREMTQNASWKIREAAVKALGRVDEGYLGEVIQRYEGALKEKQLWEDEFWRVRNAIIEALGTISPKNIIVETDRERIIKILNWLVIEEKEKRWENRQAVVKALRSIPVNEKVIRILEGALKDNDLNVRGSTIETLETIAAKECNNNTITILEKIGLQHIGDASKLTKVTDSLQRIKSSCKNPMEIRREGQ